MLIVLQGHKRGGTFYEHLFETGKRYPFQASLIEAKHKCRYILCLCNKKDRKKIIHKEYIY